MHFESALSSLLLRNKNCHSNFLARCSFPSVSFLPCVLSQFLLFCCLHDWYVKVVLLCYFYAECKLWENVRR